MHRHTIRPELRDWILTTTRAGHGVPEVLRLMTEKGYDPRESRNIVAKVLKMPVAALYATTGNGAATKSAAPSSGKHGENLRPRHPEAPEVVVDGHVIGVSASLEEPSLRVLDNLLTRDECADLIELARPRLERARTVDADGNQQVDHRRTSEGMFFTLNELPLVGRIEQRLAKLFDMPVSHGEGLQILHYLPGQEYQPHFDWFDPTHPGFGTITAVGGQRVASVVMYLNTPDQGGGTAFPEVGLTVTARRGSAVYFAYEGGDPNSLHAGLPVIRGEKWIATKWLRERPYSKPQKA